jgi:HNH endonuclease
MSANSTPDALNALVRAILTKTPTKPAPARYQFQNASAAKDHFGGYCAYCGKRPPVEFDHAMPINWHHLGEHCIGNLIPSCRECNHEKKDAKRPYGLDFRQYLNGKEGGADRIGKILDWMKKDGYTPLSDDPTIKALVEEVRADVRKALNRCVTEIRLRRG